MTKLQKIVKRETDGHVFERGIRPVIVTLEPPDLIGFRLKGTRRTYHLTSGACWQLAVKAEMLSIEREKRAAKKKGKKR